MQRNERSIDQEVAIRDMLLGAADKPRLRHVINAATRSAEGETALGMQTALRRLGVAVSGRDEEIGISLEGIEQTAEELVMGGVFTKSPDGFYRISSGAQPFMGEYEKQVNERKLD